MASSPKAAIASDRVFLSALASSSCDATKRSPLPPPPPEAFNMIGYPTEDAIVRASASDLMGSSVPGTISTLYLAADRRASTFDPIRWMDSGEGPINVMPASWQALENAAFSE